MVELEQIRKVLRNGTSAVLAMSSGGCGRYIFSSDITYRIGADGWPVLTYESPNAFHHQLLSNSGLHFIVDLEKHPDGSDHSQLVLAGKIVELENKGDARSYCFKPHHAFVLMESGETRPIALPEIARLHTESQDNFPIRPL